MYLNTDINHHDVGTPKQNTKEHYQVPSLVPGMKLEGQSTSTKASRLQ